MPHNNPARMNIDDDPEITLSNRIVLDGEKENDGFPCKDNLTGVSAGIPKKTACRKIPPHMRRLNMRFG